VVKLDQKPHGKEGQALKRSKNQKKRKGEKKRKDKKVD